MTLSFAELRSAVTALERSGLELGSAELDSIQILSARSVAAQHYPQLDPAQPVLLAGLEGPELLGDAVRTLLAVYPADHPVQLIADWDGSPASHRQPLTLRDLDPAHAGPGADEAEAVADARPSPGTALYLFRLDKPSGYVALQEIVARLRAPDGCPWDRALTWDKLRPSLLEETYELLAALDAGDADRVVEEQGDLLLQIALQTQIAVEEDLYKSPDVIAAIVEKLIRRHPHVFGDVRVSGTDEVLANWEAIKQAERKNKAEKRTPLASIPPDLPALSQADAYLDRMSRLRAEETPAAPWAELAAVPVGAEVDAAAVGRALFGLVAWAHARGVDAESALRAENAR